MIKSISKVILIIKMSANTSFPSNETNKFFSLLVVNLCVLSQDLCCCN